MSEALNPEQAMQDAVRLAEEVSGAPVSVHRDAGMAVQASTRMAHRGGGTHLIRLNPNSESQRQYLIASQCGQIIRLYRNPVEKRCDFASVGHALPEVMELLGRKLRESGIEIPDDRIPGAAEQMLSGVLIQLRSIPLSLRIDDWIRRD